ncbi:family 43 glycosylhydrolase [Cellulosimicrobium terreum]|nr:family 43 glycosylhydrolase [Cellulosimicrobium terreum]
MRHYTNPVLNADWPDPDVVRVDDDYFLVASSFNRSPGLPILHSKDLVSWTIASHAAPQVEPAAHYRRPRHGSGVWAPSIRYHDGELVVVFPDPDHGIYVTRTRDPFGEWSTPHLLLAGRGLIDPCPLWDDDGRTYLVHGWAASRAGQKNLLTLVEVDAGLTRVVGRRETVVDGDLLPGYRTLEGPKMYKRDGVYWIFAPAGGVATGWQSVFRADSPFGPYEDRIVLREGSSTVNGPHQGAWVTTPGGEDWFLHFQDRGVFGRVVHLQPMAWGSDGWPVIGEPTEDDPRCGQPVLRHRVPDAARDVLGDSASGWGEPRRSDAFDAAVPGAQWYFQGNVQPSTAVSGGGVLRLAVAGDDLGNLRDVAGVLGQQLPGYPCRVTSSVDVRGAGELGVDLRAGLLVLGRAYAWVGIERTGDRVRVVARRRDDADLRVAEPELAEPVVLAPDVASVELRLDSDETGKVMFAWRPASDGGAEHPWVSADVPFQAVEGHWIGAEVALFASAPYGTSPVPDGSRVGFGPVRFEPAWTCGPRQPRGEG